MSLLLCRQEHVSHPYFMESLGIHLYSSQEIAYVIYHYPLLVLDGFVGDGLFAFMREELDQGFLALKLERWLKSGERVDDVLVLLLQEIGYCTQSEVTQFRQLMEDLRKKHAAELKKMKADELFSMRQYGRAVELYEELLMVPADTYVNDEFRGRVWNNLGSCYARMFQLEKAFDAYEKAYNRIGQIQILEQLYELSQIDSRLKLGDRLTALVTEERKAEWDEKMKQAREKAAESEQLRELEQLFRKDPIKRQAGEAELLRKWKQEYRSMV
ncbi:MAG: tetratricopeptide repeat protein [Lachnospiraceae bacterium]|nr:tetratricopeptide repeat protein [Lachnospiraceae bacterium]